MAKSWFSVCAELVGKWNADEQKNQEDEEEATAGQDHVFAFYDELSAGQKAELDADFDDIAVEEVGENFLRALVQQDEMVDRIRLTGPEIMNWGLKKIPELGPGANLTKMSDVGEKKVSMWRSAGLDAYARGHIAVVIMAGARDSRIGGGVPKGTLDIGLLSHKSIFQLYIERVRRLQHMVFRRTRKNAFIPTYIMCNLENRYAIEDFFRENDFFGAREQDVMFFTQRNAPVINQNGKFLMTEKHKIAMYPNGNGGLFTALVQQGMIADMKSRGVVNLFVSSIDNVMSFVGDPVFMGFCEIIKADCGVKCVEKLSPEEKFGLFCSKTTQRMADLDGDGKVDRVTKTKASIVEISEVPEDLRKRREKMTKGVPPLILGEGNLSQYFFKVDFVKRTAPLTRKKWHLIEKAFAYIDTDTGERLHPSPGEKNAFRMEMFVFDSFDHAKAVVGLEVGRDEIAFVKNEVGPESPQTALLTMGKIHQEWILKAGGVFQDTQLSTEREDAKCEISPLVSYAGEDLEGNFPRSIELPFYLPSQQELLQFSAASSGQARRPSTHYLDWYCDAAQRELEMQLQGNLGKVMEMIEDTTKYEYEGERAQELENLPPTPREEEEDPKRRGRTKGKGKGKGGSGNNSAGTSAPASGKTSGASTPGGSGNGNSPRGDTAAPGSAPIRRLKELTHGAPPCFGEPTHLRLPKAAVAGGPDATAAGGSGGSLTLPKRLERKRVEYWKEWKESKPGSKDGSKEGSKKSSRAGSKDGSRNNSRAGSKEEKSSSRAGSKEGT